MSMTERAAQFGAFRALTGYENEIALTVFNDLSGKYIEIIINASSVSV